MSKIGIIYNPNAGTGKIKKLLKIKEHLDLNHSVTIFDTKKPGDATEIARRESGNFNIIVAGKITNRNFLEIHSSIGANEYHGRKIVGSFTD